MATWIDIGSDAGPIRGWRADPTGPSKGAVVVVQEIFGVNGHVREVVGRFADAGFVALAPAVMDPVERGVELDYDEAGVARGRDLVARLGFDRAVDGVGAAATLLQDEGLRTGVVGFCWGGSVALLGNTRLGLPAVSYYGGRSVPFLGEPLRAPMLFHFGAHDPIIPAADLQAHRDAYPQARMFVYEDAGHGFNCDRRGDFHAASATQAWTRTVDFLEDALR